MRFTPDRRPPPIVLASLRGKEGGAGRGQPSILPPKTRKGTVWSRRRAAAPSLLARRPHQQRSQARHKPSTAGRHFTKLYTGEKRQQSRCPRSAPVQNAHDIIRKEPQHERPILFLPTRFWGPAPDASPAPRCELASPCHARPHCGTDGGRRLACLQPICVLARAQLYGAAIRS